MANVSHLKGIRTRYRNILEKRIAECKDILSSDLEGCDLEKQIATTNKCASGLQVYNDKLEQQSEKLANALDSGEAVLIEQIIEEDGVLCANAMESYIELQQHKEVLIRLKEEQQTKSVKREISDEEGSDQVLQLQRDMQQLMKMQMQQQEKFLEVQAQKSKDTSIKLPKLDLISFNGDKTKWCEFWDSFRCSVHENKSLSNCEKFNYLRTKVFGEAKRALSGLALSDANYSVAVGILRERFGNVQDTVDLHYNRLISLQPAINKTSSLRTLLDSVTRHLRSLEVLKQNTYQDVFVSILRSKLPEDVLVQLEIQKGSDQKWTIATLQERLTDYVVARERAEKKVKESDKKPVSSEQAKNQSKHEQRFSVNTSSAHALAAVKKPQSFKYSNEAYADKCRYCKQKHWSDECSKYRTLSERKSQLKGSCYKCLKTGHMSSECKRNKTCTYCGEINAHHRSLCPKKFKQTESVSHLANEISETDSSQQVQSEENVLVSSNEMVLMQTAITDLRNPETHDIQSVRLILDSGSHRTYITEKLANRLCLKQTGEQEIKLVTFGNKTSQRLKTKCANVDVKLKNGEYISLSVNVVPVISGELQRRPVDVLESETLKHLVGSVELADTLPKENESSSIEMLIGNDYYLDFVLSQKIELQPGLYLLGSKLGWIVTGRTSDEYDNSDTCMLTLIHGNHIEKQNMCVRVDNVDPAKPDLQDFWNVESIGILDKKSNTDDETAMKMFRENVQFEKGRYLVKWPWIEESVELPTNRELAFGRLKSCVGRMRDKPELLKKYDKVIEDQVCNGVIEKVVKSKPDGVVHYLPHHAVITPQKTTTKLRVVYDASAKTRKENKSLNECLYRGPVLLQDLCGLLLRFRLHPIAIVADIEKAFLQIGLQLDQRDCTRFLWLKDCQNPKLTVDNIQEYRFCRVAFGVVSSPFLLGATVDFHLSTYQTEIAEKIRSNIYVDNVIMGAKDTTEAIQTYTEAKLMFKEASMNLREWVTNEKVVRDFIPQEDKADLESVKVLGHLWDAKRDLLSLRAAKANLRVQDVTKRNILKGIASIFDPLGLLSPVVLSGKVLLQDLWRKSFHWDDIVTEDDGLKWERILSDIEQINTCQIERCLYKTVKENEEKSLVCFCDASEKAYAAVVYLLVSSGQRSNADLVFSKTRLAPVKKLTIPKLELLAVVIGVRCLNFVKTQLRIPISQLTIFTDSKCVLSWLTSEKTLPVFERNRVMEIKKHTDIRFVYVPTEDNPADIASRGTTLNKLKYNRIWWHGPSWLVDHENDCLGFRDKEKIETITEKQISQETVLVQCNKENNEVQYNVGTPFDIDYKRFSSVTKLFRVTVLAFRFLKRIRKKEIVKSGISSEEIHEVERIWLLYVQKKHYQNEEIAICNKNQTNLGKQLGLYLDQNGLLRCSGRMDVAGLTEGSRHPIILPKKEYLTELYIQKAHKELLHSGVSQTLAHIRQRFWIVHGRATVKSVLRNCSICRRHEGGCYKMPPMCPLPKSRVTEARPFSRVGIDYFGPVFVKTGLDEKKVWVSLFTCIVTRAIHLEVVSDMTTEEFLMCLRRFVAQRGAPVEIISDNAKQFKAAKSVIDKAWYNILSDKDIQNYVSNVEIKWTFIVELAPWMGGFYERLVGLVKRSLRKTVGRKRLTLVQLQTLIKEVEAVVNSRPLIYVGEDLNSTISLTPAHFLSLNPDTGIPPVNDELDRDYLPYESSTDRLLQTWKKGQKLLNAFWHIWRNEYLLSLRERMQTSLKSHRIQSSVKPGVGDVVIVKDNISRGCWKLAKIESLTPSRDGKVRSCQIRLPSGNVLNRPLNLLFPIESTGENGAVTVDQKQLKCPVEQSKNSLNPNSRVRRIAASKAIDAIKKLANNNEQIERL